MTKYTHLGTVVEELSNPSDREASNLELEVAQSLETKQQSSVQEELKRERILQYQSTREKTRLLFITSDTAFFEAAYSKRQQLVELGEVFDEIHILVLGSVSAAPTERERLRSNIWLYGTGTRGFLKRLYDGYQRAQAELSFHDEFRADIIVALEPYEAAALAAYLAQVCNRPWQLHVDTKLYDKDALGTQPWWRTRFLKYALKRAESVRATSQAVANSVVEHYKKIPDVAVLPYYFQVHSLLDKQNMKDDSLFAQFAFTMITFGDMSASNTLYRVLDAAAPLLKTPSIGLVVIGDGPMKRHLRERAELLGVADQVIFHRSVTDPLRHLASADVFITTEIDEMSDRWVLRAAALGVPTVMAETELRKDLFTDSRDAFLCSPEDVVTYTNKLRQLLNQSTYRSLFARTAPEVVRNRIEEDPDIYRAAYRASIEAVLWSADMATSEAAAATEAAETAPESESETATAAPETVTIDGVAMKLPNAPAAEAEPR